VSIGIGVVEQHGVGDGAVGQLDEDRDPGPFRAVVGQ
jgi:hypothetical protein